MLSAPAALLLFNSYYVTLFSLGNTEAGEIHNCLIKGGNKKGTVLFF